MKLGRWMMAAMLAFSVGTIALAEDKKTDDAPKKAFKEGGCCDKAQKAGKTCEHKCCVAAEAEKKVCEKCNPPKKESK
jgi:hypothetical protein